MNNCTLFRSKLHFFCLSLFVVLQLSPAPPAQAQAIPYARTFLRSKEDVEAALKGLQAYAGQKLPIVDGFVAMGEQPLNRYERAFYQFSIDLIPNSTDITVVKLSAKITAWYVDPDPSKAGYQLLPSNGRLELDLLDRLGEKFGTKPSLYVPRTNLQAPRPKIDSSGNPLPQSSSSPAASSPGATPSDAGANEVAALKSQREIEQRHMLELKSELEGLQEIQHNQAHPRNLIVVRRSRSPVLARPTEGTKVLFTASADDEFEFIEAEGDWFHIQIAGASRGWIRRSQVESMDPRWNTAAASGNGETDSASIFKVTREESGPFPGDWEPLKGMTVKIYTVQPVSQDPQETDARAKLAFAGELLRKYATETTASTPALDGIVVIFDAVDGGIIGSTLLNVQHWASGSLSQENFWKHCYLDPPDTFRPAPNP